MMKESKLINANKEFLSGNYEQALAEYYEYKNDNPDLAYLVDFNISLLEKKITKKNYPSHEKIIIYTCNFGNYEAVKEPLYKEDSIEYILFTDNKDLSSSVWKTVVIDEKLADPRRTSRLAKILPHRYLPPHDISVYIDSSLELKTDNVRKMVAECLEGSDIALYKHYMRDCVYDEIDFVMNSTDRVVANKDLCLRAKKRYEEINYPRKNGLFENAFIFRRCTEKIKALNETWWAEYIKGTERDQFTFMYALWCHKIWPNAIKHGEQFRVNNYVNFHRHAYIPSVLEKHFIRSEMPLLEIKSSIEPTKQGVINWIVGGSDNAGWAYENNAKRFVSQMPEYKHLIQGDSSSDIALYFDVLLYDRMPAQAAQNIVRIGGPRPLERLCGGDNQKLKEVLNNFQAVVCLNEELKNRLASVHPNVHMIPNGIDLNKYHPNKIKRNQRNGFTIGFAGSVKSATERDVKGLDYVIEAAAIANVNLLNIGRGKGQVQVPHERMIEDFYSKIDLLVHPVGPGREGSSNVIMEALALGIPVITTQYAGYHSEKLENSKNVIFCPRDSQVIAQTILSLMNNDALYRIFSLQGRKFAEQHHDIQIISKQYKYLIDRAFNYHKAAQKICFIPFWLPLDDFATGRLRCAQPAKILNDSPRRSTRLGYDADADVVIISQLASDEVYQQIIDNSHQFVIYDLCDRYYADNRVVGGINAQQRFNQLAERANLIVTSTVELKKDLYNLNIKKPIVHIPDGIDFKEFTPTPKINSTVKTVGWFGNPGRGNLESAIWLLESALRLNKNLQLITKTNFLKSYPSLYPYAKEWKRKTFIADLHNCDVVVVTHAKDEQNKSPNRLLTAISQGIPVIASSSQSCEKILRKAGLEWAIVHNETELNSALELLSNPITRSMYFKLINPVIDKEYGDALIKSLYNNLLNEHVYKPLNSTKKILFVSHNLSIGEGAPTSLYQTVIGLKNSFNIHTTVFCPMTGEFKESYEKEGVKVHSYTNIVSKDSLKPLTASFEKAKADFQSFVKEEKFDMVICNTAKMLPYADFAIELGIPAIAIIRESSDEHIDITFSKNTNIVEAAKRGLQNVRQVIFVSDVTRQLWKTRHFLPRTQVIHNGIITDPWAYLSNISKAEIREKLCLPLNKKIILSVGTINARKAQIDLINAYQTLPNSLIENSCLILVGARESAYLTRLEEELLKLPEDVRSHILLIPETNNVAEWYKAADIFAFSSHNESYPRVIVEALYFGLRIISSRVFGVAEQLGKNKDASIYEIGDIASLAKAMQGQLSQEITNNTEYFYQLTTYNEMLSKYFAQICKHLIN